MGILVRGSPRRALYTGSLKKELPQAFGRSYGRGPWPLMPFFCVVV